MTDIKQVVKRKRTQSEKLNGDDIAKMRSSDDHELQLMSDEEFNIVVEAIILEQESLNKQHNHLMTDSPAKQTDKLKRMQSKKLNGDDISKMRSFDDRELQLMSDEEFNIVVEAMILEQESLNKQHNHLMTDSLVSHTHLSGCRVSEIYKWYQEPGCEAALEVLPANMEAQTKAELNKKAHSVVILCLALANKLYLKKELYTFYMPTGRKIFEHMDEFNKIVLDLANIEVIFEDKDLALLLLTSLPASYKYFVDTLLYGQEALTLKDVMAILNSKEIKERSKAKEDNGEGLYVRGRTDRRDSRQSRRKSRSKSRGGRLKCYICQSEDYLKINCPKNSRKKSTGYVKKDEQPSSSGLTYDDSELGDNRECKIRGIGKVRVQLRDESSFVLHNVRYISELKRNLISLGTLKKEGYTVKLQSGKIKVINGSRVILFEIRRDNCVYTLDGNAMEGELNDSVDEKDSLAQVWDKRLGHISEAGLQLCIESGIARHLTVARTPQLNGVVGRMNRTLMDRGVKRYRLYRLDDESPKIITSRNVVFNESVMYKDTLKDSGAGDKSVEELQVEVKLQRLNNHTPEDNQTYQEDGNDEDAGDQATDQPLDLTYYQLVQDREPKTRTKPLRFRDKSNMASCEDNSKWKAAMKEEIDSFRKNKT
nr:zinc finger, CCHC-type [Tanacetum cinerariifolium]